MMLEEKAFDDIIRLIKTKLCYDCSQYKIKCLQRRVNVRVRATNTKTYSGYLRFLKRNPGEFTNLADSLTINVTRFFRNKTVFDIIKNDLLDIILENRLKKKYKTLTFWSAGCSSGEEVYTLGIIADQFLRERNLANEMRIRIVGTDIDKASLEKAKIGIYSENSFEETPQDIIENYFSPIQKDNKKLYKINNDIKKHVHFSFLNLVTEEPQRSYDLILCRNVLIYFNKELQEQVFNTLTSSLTPGGFVVLGKTETLIGFSSPLDIKFFDKKERIYYKQEK